MNPKVEKLFNLPDYQKILLAILSCLLVLGLFWLIVHRPMQQELDGLNSQKASLERKLNEDRRIAADLPRFRAEYEKLEHQLEVALKELPNKKEIPSFLVGISALAKNTGLDVVEFKPSSVAPKGFYAEVPVSLRLIGSYHEIAMFCYHVGNMTRIVNISDMKLSGAKVKDGRNLLDVECQATTFQFVDTGPIASKSRQGKGGRK